MRPEPSVRTVRGDLESSALGPTNAHEHAFQVSPLLPGDELKDPERSAQEIAQLAGSGFASMIDATPIGLGRRPAEVRRISESTGVHIVASTGFHRDAHYGEGHPLLALDVADRAALMRRDVSEGMPVWDEASGVGTTGADPSAAPPPPADPPVRAGMLKVGIEYWAITPAEHRTLEAIAQVHAETDAPVMVHLEFCTAAHEVLDLLVSLGVPASAVLLAHADRSPDAGLHLELMARGAFLGYDGIARAKVRSDEELLDLTERVVAGGGRNLLLGGDVARASRYVSYGGMPGIAYLGARYLPRLRRRIGDRALERILVDAPARLLARAWRGDLGH